MPQLGNMAAPQVGSTIPNTMSAAQNATNSANAAQTAPNPTVPFGRAAKRHVEQGTTQVLNPWSTSNNAQLQFLAPSYGYLCALYLTVAASGGTGIVATAGPDSPWNVLNNLMLADVNGTPIFNLDGYAAYLARLYGGYRFGRPDVSTYGFTQVPAVANVPPGNVAGNFLVIFEIFQEFSRRGGLGALPNMDASAAYKLNAVFNTMTAGTASGKVYGVVPTGTPVLTNTLELLARARPNPVDAFGNVQETEPPVPGTVSYWTSQTFPIVNGTNNIIMTRVGNIVRNHILVFRDASANTLRSGAEGSVVPTTIEFDWDAGQRYIINVATQRQITYEGTLIDAPAGVVPFLNTMDPDAFAGSESGEEWIPTVGATKLQLRFNSTAAGTLQVITNDIVPGGDIYSAIDLL